MYPNQQNQNGNGYPPYPANGPQQPQYGQHGVLPPLNNTGASGHNPYEFIMSPNSKRRGLGIGGGGMGKKLVIVLCAAVLMVILVVATLMSALAPKGNITQLTAVAQRQQEIIRIATLATKQVSTQDTSNFVITTELTVTSSQTELLTYMASHGSTLKGKILNVDQSSKTDTLLENAASANNYDSTVAQVLSTQLDTYESVLQDAYKATTSKTGKALLQKTFTATEALQKQAKSVQPAS